MRKLTLLVGAFWVSSAAQAAPNLYVVDQFSGSVREFTTAGTQVGSAFTIPSVGESQRRDLIVDVSGRIHVYNGTFDPQLSTLPSGGGGWSHRTHPNWNTINNASYGGIAASGDFVFTTDMLIAGDSDDGIIRFDFVSNTSTRFANGTSFIDLNVGINGMLYGLTAGGQVRVFDPTTLALVGIVNLGGAVNFDDRAVAADAAGNLYVATWDGPIVKFGPTGSFVAQLSSGTTNLTDIDLFPDGTIIVGGRFSEFMVTDTSLTSITKFTVGPVNAPIFVGFTSPIPEPAGATVICASCLLSMTAANRAVRRR